ncbi:MAG TPA: DUF262 domain-containing protein, partial [Candidatus Krumholzibacteria bacterium]|nr:DUF262 domain-containing protein [Candidatus Krumholzibacteria bacterium]
MKKKRAKRRRKKKLGPSLSKRKERKTPVKVDDVEISAHAATNDIDAAADDATLEEEQNEQVPYKYSVTSYGADYPVDSLVKRIDRGDIRKPEFQRGFVWSLPKASRFIESLLLGLPVPGIFLARDEDTNELLIIDGQQRLLTLQYFYKGVFADSGRQFVLSGLSSTQQDDPEVIDFEGFTYDSLKEEDRRRLDDSIVHATIVKQDEPSEDSSSIYHIFERLNTGGVTLQSQEIRACIFAGALNDLLVDLNKNDAWRAIYGPIHKRMRDQELILRFLALYHRAEKYSPPMKEFLNRYMGDNRWVQAAQAQELRALFESTISAIHAAVGDDAFRPVRAFNAAVFDAVMVG